MVSLKISLPFSHCRHPYHTRRSLRLLPSLVCSSIYARFVRHLLYHRCSQSVARPFTVRVVNSIMSPTAFVHLNSTTALFANRCTVYHSFSITHSPSTATVASLPLLVSVLQISAPTVNSAFLWITDRPSLRASVVLCRHQPRAPLFRRRQFRVGRHL